MRRGGLQLLTIRGIPISLHWTFLVGFPVLVWMLSESFGLPFLWGCAVYGTVFVSVSLHELTHSIMAQRYGLTVRQIILIPIGGVAMLERIPENPRQEATIAIAGPVFNMIVAALLFGFMALVPWFMFDVVHPANNPGSLEKSVVLTFQFNVAIALFNLIPAFPTDGGRLFRSALVAAGSEYLKATRIAVTLSKVILAGFLVVGLLTLNPFLLLIAALLYFGATGEEANVRTRSALKNLRAEHLLPQEPVGVEPDTPLGEIVPLLLDSPQKHFPVIRRGKLAGLLCYPDLIAALNQAGGADRKASEIMRFPPVVRPSEPLAEVKHKLEKQNAAAALILDNGRLAGVVSQDQLRVLAGMLETRE